MRPKLRRQKGCPFWTPLLTCVPGRIRTLQPSDPSVHFGRLSRSSNPLRHNGECLPRPVVIYRHFVTFCVGNVWVDAGIPTGSNAGP